MNGINTILILSNIYSAVTGLARATISTRVFNDGKRLEKLASGKSDITHRRSARAIQWFSDHWPDDLDWPADVARPPRSLAEFSS